MTKTNQLCWSCKKCPWCNWFKNHKPIDGWTATLLPKVTQHGKEDFSYEITGCPEFEKKEQKSLFDLVLSANKKRAATL